MISWYGREDNSRCRGGKVWAVREIACLFAQARGHGGFRFIFQSPGQSASRPSTSLPCAPIREPATDDILRASIGRAARKIAERYSWTEIGERYLDIVDGRLKEKSDSKALPATLQPTKRIVERVWNQVGTSCGYGCRIRRTVDSNDSLRRRRD